METAGRAILAKQQHKAKAISNLTGTRCPSFIVRQTS